MNRKLLWIPLAVIFMATCHGAETMAYHFASEPDMWPRVEECPQLKQAPAPTAFVAAGDVLRDLTSVFRKEKIPLENGWAVWNQTQRLLVVHSRMLDQWRIEKLTDFGGQTSHAKLTIDWIRSEKPGDSPAENAPVFASLGLVGRSGLKANASAKMTDASGEWSFSLKAEPTVGDRGNMDCLLDLDWTGPEGGSTQNGSIQVAMIIADAIPQQAASWYVAGHGPAWQIRVTGDTLLVDGTSWREARLREEGGKTSVCRLSTASIGWLTIREASSTGGRKLLAKSLSSDDFRQFAGIPAEPEVAADPFAENPEPTSAPLPDLPEATIPDHLRDCLSLPMFELREMLRRTGVVLGADDFVAYDPIAEKLFMECGSDQVIDMIQALFEVGCNLRPKMIECSMWLADAAVPESPLAKIALLTKFGMKAPFALSVKDQPLLSFKAEAVAGAGIPILDLRYDFLCHLGQPTFLEWHNESFLTLADDVPFLMDVIKLPDGKTLNQGLRARVITPDLR